MKRFEQSLLITTFFAFCWLAMQVIHEAGHVLLALSTGGEVVKVALHPLIFSYTLTAENPHPLAVVWGGPLFGALFPVVLWGVWRAYRLPGPYLPRFLAGFCLVVNGTYIGIGWLIQNGADPGVMLENGSPRWVLILFGLLAFPFGLFLWHGQGRYFGLGSGAGCVDRRAALFSAALLGGLAGVEIIFNSR